MQTLMNVMELAHVNKVASTPNLLTSVTVMKDFIWQKMDSLALVLIKWFVSESASVYISVLECMLQWHLYSGSILILAILHYDGWYSWLVLETYAQLDKAFTQYHNCTWLDQHGLSNISHLIIEAICLYELEFLYMKVSNKVCNQWNSMSKNILYLSLIHISEPTRRYAISYAVFCLKKKKN